MNRLQWKTGHQTAWKCGREQESGHMSFRVYMNWDSGAGFIRPGFLVSLPEGISLNREFQTGVQGLAYQTRFPSFVARGHITQSGVPKIAELGFRGWLIRPGFQVSLPEGISLNREFQKSPNWGSGAGILDQVSKFRCQRAYHSIGSFKNRRTGVQGLAY